MAPLYNIFFNDIPDNGINKFKNISINALFLNDRINYSITKTLQFKHKTLTGTYLILSEEDSHYTNDYVHWNTGEGIYSESKNKFNKNMYTVFDKNQKNMFILVNNYKYYILMIPMDNFKIFECASSEKKLWESENLCIYTNIHDVLKKMILVL